MKERILELRKMGHSYKTICEELNCSKSTVSYHCSKIKSNNKIKLKNVIEKNKKQFKDKSFLIENYDIGEVIKLRKNKLSYSDIKEKTNISIKSISKICRMHDLVNCGKYGKLSETEIDEIRTQYDKLGSIKKVSKEMGHSFRTIRKYVTLKKRKKMTKDEIKKEKAIYVVSWRKRKKVELLEYKGGKCEKCGYSKCISALEFHHLDPNEKDFSIGGKSWSLERLKKEVDKCILLCSNCHREIHSKI